MVAMTQSLYMFLIKLTHRIINYCLLTHIINWCWKKKKQKKCTKFLWTSIFKIHSQFKRQMTYSVTWSWLVCVYYSNSMIIMVFFSMATNQLSVIMNHLKHILQYGCFESCQFRPRSVFFLSWRLNKSAGDFQCLRYYCDNVSIS